MSVPLDWHQEFAINNFWCLKKMPGLLEEKNSREEKLKGSHSQLSVRTKNKAHTSYGRHAQMPVLMTDTCADVELPDFK